MDRPPIETLLPEPDADGGSVLTRVGSVVAAGVVAAVVASLPAALRIGDGESVARALVHWVVLAALAMPVAVTAVALLRRAGVGVRLVVGERARALALGVLWWSVIELALLSAFGAVLKKTTHHHALAGVTFAVFALFSGALVALFAWRVTSMLARAGTSLQKFLGIAGGAAFVALILAGLGLSRGGGGHTGAIFVDVLALAVASTIASSRIFARVRPMALAGVPSAVVLIVVGLTTLRFDETRLLALADMAPVHAWIVDLLG